jgi:hypothetical protein
VGRSSTLFALVSVTLAAGAAGAHDHPSWGVSAQLHLDGRGARVQVHSPVHELSRPIAVPITLTGHKTRLDSPDRVELGLCNDAECETWDRVEVPLAKPDFEGEPVVVWAWPTDGAVRFVDPATGARSGGGLAIGQRSDRHVAALYKTLWDRPPPDVAWRAAHKNQRKSGVGGLRFRNVTRGLDRWPELVHGFAAIVLADSTPLERDDALRRELDLFLRAGGLIAVEGEPPRGAAVTPPPARGDRQLVRLDGGAVLRAAHTPTPGAVVERGAGRIVYVEDLSASVGDALIAVAPRLQSPPRLSQDVRRGPASIAAAVDATRGPGAGAFLAVFLAGLAVLVPFLRRRHGPPHRAIVAMSASAVAVGGVLAIAGVLVDAEPRESRVEVYRSIGSSNVAHVTTAVARRAGSLDDTHDWRAAKTPVAIAVVGDEPAEPRALVGGTQGRVEGEASRDVVLTASGSHHQVGPRLVVGDDLWERRERTNPITNRTGLDLDLVSALARSWRFGEVGPLADGESALIPKPVGGLVPAAWPTPRQDRAAARLLHDLRSECSDYSESDSDPYKCVIGVGRKDDGTLVGWRVASP